MDEQDPDQGMGAERRLGAAAGIVAGLAVLYYLYGPRLPERLTAPDEEPQATQAAAPAPKPEPAALAPEYPIPETLPATAAGTPREAPAPATAPSPAPAPVQRQDPAVSDAEVRAEAAAVFGSAPIEALLVPERVIQNIVATVDSLDRAPIPLRFRALANVPDPPVVERDGERLVLSTDNDERYRLLADALRTTNARAIANLYLRYYPLLQQAYRQMGYPDAHFNDRVVGIIDHLLATPEVEPPIELVQPKVLYRFADPALEELSSGQKILIRIGPANATIARQRLRELRAILVSGAR